MNYFRTAILLAGLTGLFMGVGLLIGGGSGALIAFVVAGAMTLDARQAGFLFRAPMTNGTFSGATLWGR